MSCYLNLLKTSSHVRPFFRTTRSFSFSHQNSTNVISRKNFFGKRFKSNDSIQNKAGEEVKVQKVKLKASDLRRLLSLAKTEKWKITGNELEVLFFSSKAYQMISQIFCQLRCNWLSHHFVINNHGSSFWFRKNPRYYLRQ